MNTAHLEARSPFHGVLEIARFNWPFYVTGLTAASLAVGAALLLPMPSLVAVLLVTGAALAMFWQFASLLVSHFIYDRSALARWNWIAESLDSIPARWVNLHAGLDESSRSLQAMWPRADGRVLDFFDASRMTEPSIARARRLAHNAILAEPVDFRRLPLAAESCDVATLLLSAHELRTHRDRVALLSEVRRALAAKGRVVLAEHLRDGANFLAFGPGFLHFHLRRQWLAAVSESDLVVEKEFRITPFIAVFILRRSP